MLAENKKSPFKILTVSLLLPLIFVLGCSSSSEKSDETESGSENQPPTPTNARDTGPAPKHSAAPPLPEKPSVSSLAQGLSEAVKNQNDEQIEQLSSQVLSQNPKDIRALNALAMNHFRKGRIQLAKMLLLRALEAHPKSSELHNNMGVIELSQKNDREALIEFKKAVELKSDNASASANLGAIYLKGKDYKRATTALEIAVDNGLKDWKTKNNYAVALAGSGKADKAEDLYKDILKEQPSNKEAMMNYSILLIDQLNKPQEGLDLLNKLRFIGIPTESRNRVKELENKAQASQTSNK
ncbi:MAG: tetratricopeptide repeat protein [Pseudobdellovibrionaceae bacterium]